MFAYVLLASALLVWLAGAYITFFLAALLSGVVNRSGGGDIGFIRCVLIALAWPFLVGYGLAEDIFFWGRDKFLSVG